MRKTIALFGIALALLLAALVIGLRTTTPPAPPPVETPMVVEAPIPPQPPIAAAGRSSISIGEVVRLDGSLSNNFLRVSDASSIALLMDLVAKDSGMTDRSRMAVAIVIDRSGSMAGEKIRQAREASKQFVSRLTDDDQIAVVTYSSDYSVDLPLTTIKGQRSRIDRVIDDILDGGGTDIGSGLQAGVAALRGASANAVKRLLLVSDGNANQGITDPAALAAIAKRSKQDGITVSCLGVGVDFNEDLLAQMAQGAGGGYYYARDPDAIAQAFDKELAGLTKLAARSVEVGLDLGPNVSISQVYGYRTEMRRGRVIIPVGDMSAGEKRRVMVELKTSAGAEGRIDISNVVLAFNAPVGDDVREFQGQLSAIATSDTRELGSGERREVTEAFEAAVAARAREQAAFSYQAGNRSMAVNSLKSQISETKKKNTELKSVVLEEQLMEMEDTLKSISTISADSDEGKDIVKHEKLRARQVFAY
jgi:Ca-activated chloride channel homolog